MTTTTSVLTHVVGDEHALTYLEERSLLGVLEAIWVECTCGWVSDKEIITPDMIVLDAVTVQRAQDHLVLVDPGYHEAQPVDFDYEFEGDMAAYLEATYVDPFEQEDHR